MCKPVIGITPHWSIKEERLALYPCYADGIMQAGGLPLILPLTTDKALLEQICQLVDGLLFSGGDDIYPGLYGEAPIPSCSKACGLRDSMESFLLTRALEMDKPIFGICRGFQIMNVLLGGSLYQDLPSQYGTTTEGKQICHSQPYRLMAHNINITRGSPLHMHLNKEVISVNSCHHQGVRTLSEQVSCMATSEDGLVEAFYMPGKNFVWAVQWHPESILYDEYSRKLFDIFLSQCG